MLLVAVGALNFFGLVCSLKRRCRIEGMLVPAYQHPSARQNCERKESTDTAELVQRARERVREGGGAGYVAHVLLQVKS